jgi:regulator of sirC expression with transglutaminase-like and TPR domain
MTDKTKRIIFWSILLAVAVYFGIPAIRSAYGLDFRDKLDYILPKDKNNFDFTKTIVDLSVLIDPAADRQWTINEVQRMASELKPIISSDVQPDAIMRNINNYLFETNGYALDEKANSAFLSDNYESLSTQDWLNYDSITRVMQSKRGICMSMSLIYLMIADKLGLPIYGVVIPHHIFVRYQEPGHSGINSDVNYKGTEFYGYSELSDTEFIDKSKVMYNKPLSRYETVAAALNNFGILLMQEHQFIKAHMMFDRSIAMMPDFPETHTMLGVILQAERHADRAEAEFKKSLELFPDFELAYIFLGLLYLDEKRFTLAQDNLEAALKLDPANGQIISTLEKLKKEKGM